MSIATPHFFLIIDKQPITSKTTIKVKLDKNLRTVDFQRNNHVIYYIVSILMIFCFCLYFLFLQGNSKDNINGVMRKQTKTGQGRLAYNRKSPTNAETLINPSAKKNSEHFKNILHVI